MAITLREITRANWRECVSLETTPEQRHFVATNAVSLAQATYESEWVTSNMPSVWRVAAAAGEPESEPGW